MIDPFNPSDLTTWVPANLDENGMPAVDPVKFNIQKSITQRDGQVAAKATLACTPQDRRI